MKLFKAIIGDSEKVVIDIVTDILEERAGNGRAFQIRAYSKANDLLRFAENDPSDIFVLHINNILFDYGNMPPQVRMSQVMHLINIIKKKYNKPIITIGNYSALHTLAMASGADFFIRTPFELEEFRKAICDSIATSYRVAEKPERSVKKM